MVVRFRDRRDAGHRLALALEGFRGPGVVVLGLPRGGVIVAAEVAERLGAPLDVLVVRKLGAPSQPELGIGAIAEGGVVTLNQELIDLLGVTDPMLDRLRAGETAELERRVQAYRGHRPAIDLTNKTVLIVDDGLATGFTARAAVRAARARGATRVILAVPVGAPETVAELRREADEVICLATPRWFGAVGQWYDDFRQTTDEEVVEILDRATRQGQEEVLIGSGSLRLPGILRTPPANRGLVVFAHGSGSSRLSPRNQSVAAQLNDAGFATLLFDLLTDAESRDRRNVFDIPLLAERLEQAIDWATSSIGTGPIGLFGASTGAAAALWTASQRDVAAVVSRGGRPDLAEARLPLVTAPTLLIVGSADTTVLELNRRAAQLLAGPNDLAVVPGAGHLFEEPGALEQVAELASEWFIHWMH